MAATPETRITQGVALAAEQGANTRVTNAETLVAFNYPTPSERTTQAEILSAIVDSAPERVTNAFILVAIKEGAGRRRLRAWTFTQDDHDFYVLQLNNQKTLVLDLSTNQWSMWKSPNHNVWRANKGIAWGIDNVAGDDTYGIIWDIAGDQRLDDDAEDQTQTPSPIQSIIRGLYPTRLRNALGCYRAALTCSEGEPSIAGVGLTLRTSDDFGKNWLDHGTIVPGDDAVFDIAWSSLGIMTAPGRIFEITDDGYAQRIDALDIDLGPDEGKTGGQ